MALVTGLTASCAVGAVALVSTQGTTPRLAARTFIGQVPKVNR